MHQPEHLPWLGFFDKMRRCDVLVLLDTVQFARRDFQNRNRIKGPGGAIWLTVPVTSKGKVDQSIEDVEICNDQNWRKKCWNAIHHNYAKAPYFSIHRAFFEELYAREWTRLVELNVAVIRYLAEQLGIGTRIVASSELDVRVRGGTDVALGVCRAVGADVYLSGPFGKNYLDEGRLAESSIDVEYHDFEHPRYPQLFGGFLPQMSAIDLLFNCGKESCAILESANR